MKYNSIEWLIRELDLDNDGPTMKAINKARAMHKEEMDEKYHEGYQNGHDVVMNYIKNQTCICGKPKIGGYTCDRTNCNQNL